MKQLFPTRNVMSPSLLLHALRTQLSMLLALFKRANTPAEMSLSNDTFSDVFPAIQITVDRGSSSKDREGNRNVIPQRYSRLKTKNLETSVRYSIIVRECFPEIRFRVRNFLMHVLYSFPVLHNSPPRIFESMADALHLSSLSAIRLILIEKALLSVTAVEDRRTL